MTTRHKSEYSELINTLTISFFDGAETVNGVTEDDFYNLVVEAVDQANRASGSMSGERAGEIAQTLFDELQKEDVVNSEMYTAMKTDGVFDRFFELYDKKVWGEYMTPAELSEYNELVDKYIIGFSK